MNISTIKSYFRGRLPSVRFLGFLGMLFLVREAAYGQLHLIAGTPTPRTDRRFASSLFQVGKDGSVHAIAELTSEQDGLEWISIAYDFKKAVLASQYPQSTVSVIDLETAAVSQTCGISYPAGKHLIEQWLADLPREGFVYQWEVIGSDLKLPSVESLLLNQSTSCGDRIKAGSPADMKYAFLGGLAGVTERASWDGLSIAVTSEGKLRAGLAGMFANLDCADFPNDWRRNAVIANLVARNSQILVVQTVDKRRERAQSYVFRRSDRTWHVIPVDTYEFPPLRAIGKFVALVGTHAKKKGTATAQSAGSDEWRKEDSHMGPSTEQLFGESEVVYPGRLYLYDTDSEKISTIDTHQGDSEILLVEDNTVYYRASDRLYSAPFTNQGIGAAKLLARDEAIRDAHWAFIKH